MRYGPICFRRSTRHSWVHAGPSPRVAIGESSVLADLTALTLADYAVSGAGHGTDLGLEKLIDITARTTGVLPDVAVVVCSVPGIKPHATSFCESGGVPSESQLARFAPPSLDAGPANPCKHIINLRRCDLPVLVAIERNPTDADWEIDRVGQVALNGGAEGRAVVDPCNLVQMATLPWTSASSTAAASASAALDAVATTLIPGTSAGCRRGTPTCGLWVD